MKIADCSPRPLPSRGQAGFTLPEAIISATLLVLLLGGVVSANLFGLRMFQIAQTKLKADDGARKALGVMADEIRKSNSTWVGNVTNGTFVALVDGEPQSGSALMIQPTTNATNFVIYFLNPGDQTFRRLASASASTTLLAQTVTNATIFSAQDCFGNVLTNSQNNRVIHACLDFVQPQPWLPAPDYSQLETSVTRRITD
jgi:Tfp pilus assembly protein PilW